MSAVIYAAVVFALALVRDFLLLLLVMLLSGTAWITVLSSLQVATQTSVPNWVRARAVAVYTLVFFGCMAAGGLLWGFIASHTSLTTALLCAGSLMLISIPLTMKFKLPVTELEDLAPSLHWPQPLLKHHEEDDPGSVMVTLIYDIDPLNADAFQEAMVEVSNIRKRNGAFSWGLVQDSENAYRWLEFFMDESWLEHVRHHGRVTESDKRLEARARHYQTDGIAVKVSHYIMRNKKHP